MTKDRVQVPKISEKTQLIDTHCHLDMAVYKDDLTQVLSSAEENGVSNIISIGIDLASSKNAISLASRFKQIQATIGVHPHDVNNLSKSDYSVLEELFLTNSRHIVGYGEIGLDYVKNYSSTQKQREHFAYQLHLASDLNLPIIIHNREADKDTLDILKKSPPLKSGGILHCFSSDLDFANQVIDLGLLISIPGIVTFKNATKLHEVVKNIPFSSMVLETDGPFLAPHPFRGKRNEPSLVVYTAQKIAELRKVSLDEVAEQTTQNARKLFNIH